jgi:flagellar basal-body rod protein FlgG
VNHAVYSAVSGSLSALDRLEALTNNLANASTPGFKAQTLLQRSTRGRVAPGAAVVGTPVNRAEFQTDFSQGSIEHDGSPYHLALDGTGFFVVKGQAGEHLTRRGTFSLDTQGFLVSSDGQRVQGDSGDLQLREAAQDGPIQIANDGTIEQGTNRLGHVRVVTVADPQKLQRAGSSQFLAGSQQVTNAPDGTFKVEQGALESTNASPIQSLVSMIETMRGFDAYMNATTRLDQVNERALTDLARV